MPTIVINPDDSSRATRQISLTWITRYVRYKEIIPMTATSAPV